MKKLLFFFLLVFSFSALAVQKIVILSSIENLPVKIQNSIDKKFNEAFKNSGYEYSIEHSVNAETLSSYLTSDKVYAVFYISHATSARNIKGVPFSSAIINKDGLDVSKLFQKVNPNIKFLSVIGCSAKKILDAYKEKNYFDENLRYFSFDDDVIIHSAIDKAIRDGAELYDNNPKTFHRTNPDESRKYRARRKEVLGIKELMNQPLKPILTNDETDGITIKILNTNNFEGIISVNEVFIGVLKKQSSTQNFYLPYSLMKYGKIKLIVNYPKAVLKDGAHSLFLQSSDRNIKIKHPIDDNGKPFGGNINFYYLSYE